MGAPSGGIKIEIEFVSGTWTDVSTDFDQTNDITISWGQTSETSGPQVTTLALQLDNVLGKYTPQRAVLADGVTANPYYPNVAIRKRIRVSYTTATATYVRFLGYIKSWQPIPATSNGTAKTQITASSRDDKLGRMLLQSPMMQTVQADSPLAFYPLTDASGSTTADDPNSLVNLNLQSTGATALSFGQSGPGASGEGTAVRFAPSTYDDGQVLGADNLTMNVAGTTYPAALSYTVEAWVNAGTSLPSWATSTDENILGVDDSAGEYAIALSLDAGVPTISDYTLGSAVGTSSIVDGKWHHIVAVRSGTSVTLWVDGVLEATAFGGSMTVHGPATRLRVGDSFGAPSRFQGSVGFVAIYAGTTTINPAAHYAAGLGWVGDTTGQRVQRYLAFGGLTSADWNVDTGKCVVGAYPTAGVDVVSACRAMSDSEGGGSAFYLRQDGVARFCDRWFRKPGAPVMTVDAEADCDDGTFVPSLDDTLIVNQATVTQQSGPNTVSTFIADNESSESAFGTISTTVTSFAVSPNDTKALAQWHTTATANAATRLETVTVDFYTAQTTGLYDALPSIELGSRLRVKNLPKWMPASQLDVIVEGATETINVDKYTVAFATSPADNPPRLVFDDPTYGRWQASGCTLNAAISASASSLAIATVAGNPTFTVNSASYPLTIVVDAEVITLTGLPGGSTSPQSYTGVLRGQQGTQPAAHAAGATVDVWPKVTFTL